LVWDDLPIFEEDFQAWANGPVCPDLYRLHSGQFIVSVGSITGELTNILQKHQDTIRSVLKFYGNKSAQVLSDLTHSESPWLDARGDLPPGTRGDSLITKAAIAEYYSSL